MWDRTSTEDMWDTLSVDSPIQMQIEAQERFLTFFDGYSYTWWNRLLAFLQLLDILSLPISAKDSFALRFLHGDKP